MLKVKKTWKSRSQENLLTKENPPTPEIDKEMDGNKAPSFKGGLNPP